MSALEIEESNRPRRYPGSNGAARCRQNRRATNERSATNATHLKPAATSSLFPRLSHPGVHPVVVPAPRGFRLGFLLRGCELLELRSLRVHLERAHLHDVLHDHSPVLVHLLALLVETQRAGARKLRGRDDGRRRRWRRRRRRRDRSARRALHRDDRGRRRGRRQLRDLLQLLRELFLLLQDRLRFRERVERGELRLGGRRRVRGRRRRRGDIVVVLRRRRRRILGVFRPLAPTRRRRRGGRIVLRLPFRRRHRSVARARPRVDDLPAAARAIPNRHCMRMREILFRFEKVRSVGHSAQRAAALISESILSIRRSYRISR